MQRFLKLHPSPLGPSSCSRLMERFGDMVEVLPQPVVTINCSECVARLIEECQPTAIEFAGMISFEMIESIIAAVNLTIRVYRSGDSRHGVEVIFSHLLNDPSPPRNRASSRHLKDCSFYRNDPGVTWQVSVRARRDLRDVDDEAVVGLS